MSRAARMYAWGEVKDHKRSYGIIIMVIALTMTAFILVNAAILYTGTVVVSTTKRVLSGDGVILAPGSDERDLYGGAGEIPEARQVFKAVESLEGYQASLRMTIQGTYNLGDGFDACTIQGLDLKNDPFIEEISDSVAGGEWFDPEEDYLHHHIGTKIDLGDVTEKIPIGGMNLGRISFDLTDPSDPPYPIVIGVTATKVHPIEIGDVLTLTVTKGRGEGGEAAAFSTDAGMITVKVIGTYESSIPTLDQMAWFMPIDCMREIKGYGEVTPGESASISKALQVVAKLANLPGVRTVPNLLLSALNISMADISHMLTEISSGLDKAEGQFVPDPNRGEIVFIRAPEPPTHLNDLRYSDSIKEELETTLAPITEQSGIDYEIFPFATLIEYASGQSWQMSTIINWGMMTTILLLAGFAIYYTMDSIVVRKTREIGSLKAFGARDRVVLQVFLYQAVIVGILAGAVGVGLGVLTMSIINWQGGIAMEFIGGTQLNIRFLTPWYVLAVDFLLPVLVAILAAIIPAERAARLSPVEALRKGEIAL
jgi:hypothetical protein